MQGENRRANAKPTLAASAESAYMRGRERTLMGHQTMQLTGIHHLTAVSADAPGNRAFYTGVLGMRLVKKTVNQDDVSAYHLFYADGLASARHRPHLLRLAGRPRSGAAPTTIIRTALRVAGREGARSGGASVCASTA